MRARRSSHATRRHNPSCSPIQAKRPRQRPEGQPYHGRPERLKAESFATWQEPGGGGSGRPLRSCLRLCETGAMEAPTSRDRCREPLLKRSPHQAITFSAVSFEKSRSCVTRASALMAMALAACTASGNLSFRLARSRAALSAMPAVRSNDLPRLEHRAIAFRERLGAGVERSGQDLRDGGQGERDVAGRVAIEDGPESRREPRVIFENVDVIGAVSISTNAPAGSVAASGSIRRAVAARSARCQGKPCSQGFPHGRHERCTVQSVQ